NISTRAKVLTGADAVFGGFVISGSVPKRVVMRAIGPTLAASGVPGVLPDPILHLFDVASGQFVATNDNWQSPPSCGVGLVCENTAQIVGTNFDPCLTSAPNCSKESVLIVTLPPTPQGYGAVVLGVGDTTGVALVEVNDFDAAPSNSRLINISTRAKVLTGADAVFGGFVINGNVPKRVVLRAIGPSLAASGVPGPLPDPILHLFDVASGQ